MVPLPSALWPYRVQHNLVFKLFFVTMREYFLLQKEAEMLLDHCNTGAGSSKESVQYPQYTNKINGADKTHNY